MKIRLFVTSNCDKPLLETEWDILPVEGRTLYLFQHVKDKVVPIRTKFKVVSADWIVNTGGRFFGEPETSTYIEVILEEVSNG